MRSSPLSRIVAYGALAGVVLLCLQLISMAPMALGWGRELIGAAIALIAVVVGMAITRAPHHSPPPRPTPNLAQQRLTAPEAAHADEASAPVAASGSASDTLPDLSPREREVLELLCTGLSNKQIARAACVREHRQDASGQRLRQARCRAPHRGAGRRAAARAEPFEPRHAAPHQPLGLGLTRFSPVRRMVETRAVDTVRVPLSTGRTPCIRSSATAFCSA